MPGPAPKAEGQRRRRNATPGTVVLPSAGRPGPAPKWPLSGRPPKVWPSLWALPQAVAWERLHLDRVVARYAAKLTDAEQQNATSSLLGEVRQMEDRLGLSPMAMLRLRWEIDEVSEPSGDEGTVAVLDHYRRMIGDG